jgi:hypothetical protein
MGKQGKISFTPWLLSAVIAALLIFGFIGGFDGPRGYLNDPNWGVIPAISGFIGGFSVIFIPVIIIVYAAYRTHRKGAEKDNPVPPNRYPPQSGQSKDGS